MKLEDQVCSLELSKRLKELGVKQDAYFSWYAFENPLNKIFKESDLDDDMWNIETFRNCSKGGADWTYSAFMVSELGEMLPKKTDSVNDFYELVIYTSNSLNKWIVSYKSTMHPERNCELNDENLANAMAKMLVYLLENG